MLAAALGPCKVRLGPESALTGSGPFSFYVLFRKFVVSVIWEIKNPDSFEAGFVECFCENILRGPGLRRKCGFDHTQ